MIAWALAPLALALSVARGEPATGITRSCVTGELCVVTGLAGTGLADGDVMAVLSLCGTGPPLSGMPGGFGESLAGSSGGTHFIWPGLLLVDGGEYRLCWCSVASPCSHEGYFTTDVGTMVVTGPVSGLEAACVSGRLCSISNIQGVYLQDGDSVMVLTACGGAQIDGFPNGAKTSAGALQGSEHGWGEAKISALGGEYALCWCAKGATCDETSEHRKRLGTLTVTGPAGNLVRVCGAHEDCTWSGVTGTGLLDGDRIMLLKTCGEGPIVPGFPNGDIATAAGGGGDYSFGADNLIRAGGHEYAMCWCQPSAEHVCAGPRNFLTPAGILIVSGAASDHDVSCVQGQSCKLLNFHGVGLTDGDQVQVLLECGTSSAPSNWPNGAIAVATSGGAEYLTWDGQSLDVQFGNYRICWCKTAWTCADPADFKMDAGALRVVGINQGQSRSCHAGAPCLVAGLLGSNLRNGDLIKVMTECGTGDEVLGFPNNSTSLPATDLGSSYSWGVAEVVEAAVGAYKMCWCPYGNADGCGDKAFFVSEAGTLTLRGPADRSFNASCVAGQSPSCLVGPIQDGVDLTYGSDRITLLSSLGTCGLDAPDAAMAGGLSKQVESDQMVRFLPSDLPFGGTWKMCYCANFDSSLDQEALPCQSQQDFAATAGFLTVVGAFSDQVVNCTRNQVCSFEVQGNGLNSGIHRLALADQTFACGDAAVLDTATRRRRDIANNPYTATGVTAEGYLTFTVDPIQALEVLTLCVCVPPPGGSLCSASSLSSYHQSVGVLDVRGAQPGQSFTCGRGGRCTLDVAGRGLSALDRAKIVNFSTDCTGEPQEAGFFKSLLIADPAPATSSTSARFSLGQVTAGGVFKVCYCASLDACNSLEAFNHQAGQLEVLDPLSDLSLFSSTVASITVQVQSRLQGMASRIRCAISEYEPSFMPNGADIANGLSPIGLGQGEATEDTVDGANYVEMHFKTFVNPSQQYRVWCVESSAQSFILPQTPGGVLITTPADLQAPRLRVFPSFLWPQASFYAELYNVYAEAVSARRLAFTEARIQTSASPYMCNQMIYDSAVDMVVADAGTGQYDARLISSLPLQASPLRLYLCFFSKPAATGIALTGDDRLTVHKQAPSFSMERLDGLTLQRFYRGVLLRVHLEAASGEGLLHWTSQADFEANGCAGAARAPPLAKSVTSSTDFFRTQDPAGFYQLCYLGVATGSEAPLNSLGPFELAEVIHSVAAASNPGSDRNTLRLTLEVRMPGTVTCLARKTGTVSAADFSSGVLYEGRASMLIPTVEAGMDPEFPRTFSLLLPLVEYQRVAEPMRVWCLHSLADTAVFPDGDGALIPLEDKEPFVTARPQFLWTSAKFRLTLSNTPPVNGKQLAMHAPALPFGWSRQLVTEDGAQVLRYVSPTGQVLAEHPRYTEWLNGERLDLCLGANASRALDVDSDAYTRTSGWFVADAEECFVCYWASPNSFPHLVGKIDIRAQAPERLLEVVGQFRPFVYRGASLTLRLRHGSPSGGRLLVIKKALYEAFGQNCQDMSLARRLEGEEEDTAPQGRKPWPQRRLQSDGASGNCTNAPRRSSDLKLVSAEEVFPTALWGEEGPAGANCTRDFRLYWSPNLELTAILGDKSRHRYILVTQNASVLELFVQRIRTLTTDGQLPQNNQVVVYKDFTDISQSIAQHFVASTADCSARLLLDPASPMYEEGAEDLPLSQYLQAALPLEGFDFLAVAYLPSLPTVIEKELLCPVLHPPAPPPPRQETAWDIDLVGVGRPVVNGQVFVPSQANGSSSFLHSEPLGEYVVCYAGDEDAEPIFNRIGPVFPSLDVLSGLHTAEAPPSTTLAGHLNVTSQLPGVARCLGFLDTLSPPQEPKDIFLPVDSQSFLGESDLVQYDVPGTYQVIMLRLLQSRVNFLAPSFNFAGAPPNVFVWCAHEGSTVLYPGTAPMVMDVQARQPPAFVYKQFNATVTSIDLTLQLEFTPLVVEFTETFPRNYYDEVNFRSRPSLPAGLILDASTGALSGVPTFAGSFPRALLAISQNPPQEAAAYSLLINVKDVLGPRFTSASADNMLVSIQPRYTNIFHPQKAFLLARKRTSPFTDTPEEFFCINALRDVPNRNVTEVVCSVQDEVCCCAAYILLHMPVQDLRLRTSDCSFLPTERYHLGGLVEGLLQTSEGVLRPARLHSSYKVYATMPPEVTAQDKKPVRFDLMVVMDFEDYEAQKEFYDRELLQELAEAVFIPQELVDILKVEPGRGGTVFTISFYVEPRCLQELGPEVELLSFGINTKEGCNLVAPVEYMTELKTQLSNKDSALFYQQDLVLLNKVNPDRSFSFAEQHFCSQEPFWQYGAVAASESECPYDLVKLGSISAVAGTVTLALLLSAMARLMRPCGFCLRLSEVRMLDVLTPLLGLYTTGAAYVWLFYLQGNAVHALHGTLFMACLCNLFLCFVVNAAALRMTITSYIIDTPWWRKNRKRLRIILLLSVFSPRFFRITNSRVGGDRTQIHFGTPSKMAVVFAKLGLATLLQDIPLLLVQLYVWLIWRNLAPKVSLLCFGLGLQSIATTILHHVFSRSQRAAYERVVKLLGVRRLTAGFFDVSSGVGTQAGRASEGIRSREDAGTTGGPVDPTKLDPIQAAMYVAQMYDKRQPTAEEKEELSDSSGEEQDSPQAGSSKTLYPSGLYEKMRRFYAQHDPSKLASIGRGNAEVDEEALDVELKSKFGVGLDSIQ